ncbi:uncharacterized protein FIBRA_00096 [Fibroporia radiculosa]|uniref:Uncharacterized protein n=1 Tax=Fibroporia radiculosa TaxID=599839 RepID=J7RG66_9APHY|nr:uncharacterized protein FIBRA_00096 [Fibroporia radiculosa]CCL98102.1 predicted protein [Fibroporia radiculosa]
MATARTNPVFPLSFPSKSLTLSPLPQPLTLSLIAAMLANPTASASALPPSRTDESDIDPFILYAQSLHDYTLRLWTESRRIAEEKARARAAEIAVVRKREEEKQRQKKTGTQPSSNAV